MPNNNNKVEEVYLLNRETNNPQAPRTFARLVVDSAKSRTLDQSLTPLVERNALGYPAFSTVTAYTTGNIVFYDRKLWKFTADKPAGDWDATKVEPASIKEEMEATASGIDNAKADKVSEGTAGHLVSLDASGNIADSGSAIENAPIKNSNNVPKSGGVWSAIQNAIDSIKEWANGIFAKIDGYYKTLVCGASENLVGHGTVPAEYTFRTAGGTADIGSGTASIDVMKGKTLKWNQLLPIAASGTYTKNDVTFTIDGHGNVSIQTAQSGASNDAFLILAIDILPNSVGHKIFLGGVNTGTTGIKVLDNNSYNFYNESAPTIFTKSSGTSRFTIKVESGSIITTPVVISPFLIDLTLMFGEGKEPSTVAEFEALYPLDYYAYTATPILINNVAKGIVTTGFNQWDEEWEQGRISTSTGQNQDGETGIRTKNYIPVFQGQTYYGRGGSRATLFVVCYDENKNNIKGVGSGGVDYIDILNKTFVIPNGCAYIRWYSPGENSYSHDICINLSWSGYRNGEYEPYEKHTLLFNGESGSLATLTGKKIVDGEATGESVTIFPEGMKSAGSVYDFGKADSDGYIRKVTKKLGVVDLGDLTWTKENEHFYATVAGAKGGSADSVNIFVCSKYTSSSRNSVDSADKQISLHTYENSAYTVVHDTAYISQDASAFKTAMAGVKLYYELKTPEEYLLDTPIPANYIVNDFGTEERIPEDTASVVSAPISYEVKYAMNAVDSLRRLPVNYIKKESMDNFTAELSSKLGTFLNASISITPSYDATNEEYDYDITITSNETQGE